MQQHDFGQLGHHVTPQPASCLREGADPGKHHDDEGLHSVLEKLLTKKSGRGVRSRAEITISTQMGWRGRGKGKVQPARTTPRGRRGTTESSNSNRCPPTHGSCIRSAEDPPTSRTNASSFALITKTPRTIIVQQVLLDHLIRKIDRRTKAKPKYLK